MDSTRTARPRPAPLPLSPHRAEGRRFWDQSFDKAVGPTDTMFGTRPVPAPADRAQTPLDPALVQALAQSAPGERSTVAGDGWAALRAAASAAVAVRRATAADEYVLHRAYPSARALFGVDLEEHSADGTRAVFLPWSPSMTTVGSDHGAVGRGSGTSAPLIVARLRPDRYPSPYGTLRPSLARLEAGHLLATVAAAAYHLGLDPVSTLEAAEVEAGRLILAGRPERSGWSIPGSAVARLVELSTAVGAAPDPPDTVDAWFSRRTSGPTASNLVTAHAIPDPQVRALEAVVAAGLRAVGHLAPPEALTVHRCTLPGRAMTGRTLTPVGPDGPGASTPMSATGSWASAVGLTWSIDPWELTRTAGPAALERVHVLLGWLSQWVCLTAANLGIAARPVRNFDEATWAHDLGLPPSSVPAYQLWLRPLTPTDLTPAVWTTHGRTL